MGHDPDHLEPRLLARRRRGRRTSSGRAPSRPMPVSSLRWARAPSEAARRRRLGRPDGHLGAGGDGPRPLVPDERAHDEHRGVEAGGAQGLGLGRRRHAQAARAPLERGPGDGGRPVPVAVGLDHGQQLGPRGRPGEDAGVVTDGPQVDPGHGALGGQRPHRARAPGSASMTSPATRPSPRPASSAARPWAATAAAAPGKRLHPLGQGGRDDAGQHVARAGGGQGGRARAVDHRRAARRAGDRARALQHHHGAGQLGQLAGAGQAVGLHLGPLASQQPRRLAGVGREDRRRGPPAQPRRALAQVPEAVGVDHRRERHRLQHVAHERGGPGRAAEARAQGERADPAGLVHHLRDARRPEAAVLVGDRRGHDLEQVRRRRPAGRRAARRPP